MKSFLRAIHDHLVPHKGNNHAPRLLHTSRASKILLVLAVFQVVFLAHAFLLVPLSSFLADISSSALVDLANGDRAHSAVAPLKGDSLLTRAAQLKAEDMAARGYFAHTSPDGVTPWHWFDLAGYNFSYAGENLAINYSDTIDVERAWMNSAEHRDNIVNADFHEVGVGVAEGMYEGKKAVFVAELFGTKADPVVAREKGTVAHGASPIAVRKSRSSSIAVAPVPSQTPSVLAAHAESEITPAVALSSPEHALSWAYLALGALVSLVALLLLSVKRKPHHKQLFANALILLCFMTASFAINGALINTMGSIESGLVTMQTP